MESFGRYLRAEREAREVSIEDLAEVTKINRHVLIAMEADDFENLPPPVFVRGFVRTICKTLNLPSDELLARYNDYVATHGPGAPRPDTPPGSSDEALRSQATGALSSNKGGPIAFIAVVMLLAAAVVLAYRFAARRDAVSVAPAPVQEAQPPAPEPKPPADEAASEEPAAEPAEGEAAAPAEAAKAAAAPSGAEAEQVETKWIVVQARGQCWIQITRDAEGPRDYTLKPGERFAQRYADRLELKVGDPSRLLLEADGKKYDVVGRAERPVTLNFPLSQNARRWLDQVNRETRTAQEPPETKSPPAAASSSETKPASQPPAAPGGGGANGQGARSVSPSPGPPDSSVPESEAEAR